MKNTKEQKNDSAAAEANSSQKETTTTEARPKRAYRKREKPAEKDAGKTDVTSETKPKRAYRKREKPAEKPAGQPAENAGKTEATLEVKPRRAYHKKEKTEAQKSDDQVKDQVNVAKSEKTEKPEKPKNELIAKIASIFSKASALPNGQRTSFINQLETELKKLNLGNGDQIDGLIFLTKDIDQFKLIPGNRLIDANSAYIRELASSLKELGNVVPAIINEKGELADGQRRVTAIRKYQLRIPLRYTRKRGADISTVGEINRNQYKWNFRDWMHKYVTIGKPDYLEYQEIEKKYGKYMRPRSLRSLIMNNRVESFKSEVWEGGNFTIDRKTLDLNIHFLELLSKVYLIGEADNIFARNRNFQKALFNLLKKNDNQIDENRLLKKIRNGFNRLNVRTEYEEYSKILDELYSGRRKAETESKNEPAKQDASVEG